MEEGGSPGRILSLSAAHQGARALHVGARLGVFDALEGGGKTADDLALGLGTDPRGTRALLAALTAAGLLEVNHEGRFFNGPEASLFLTTASPRSLLGMVEFEGRSWATWGRLEDAVRTGRPQRRADMFQSLADETEAFLGAMEALARGRGDAVVLPHRLPFDSGEHILDVGAGPGTYSIALCQAIPGLRATLFDLPGSLAVARRKVAEAGLTDRVDFVTGDYRQDPLPEGFDGLLLFNILHGEGEEECRKLLRSCHGSLKAGGVLVIKEHVLDDTRTLPGVGAAFALVMLLNTEAGDCYSFAETAAWLTDAGFTDITEEPPRAPLTSSLVLARRPGAP